MIHKHSFMKILFLSLLTIVLICSFSVASETCTDDDGDGYCIEVVAPTSSEEYHSGDNMTIRWIQTGIDSISIMYKYNYIADWVITGHPVDPEENEGSYEWEIPANMGGRKNMSIEIIAYKSGIGSETAESEKFDVFGICDDSDGGKNYDEKGTVVSNGYSYTDRCITSAEYPNGALEEYFCNELNSYESEYYECELGCQYGKCKNCIDECSYGKIECYDEGYRSCGNYDQDECYEWSAVTECQLGCEDGNCIIPEKSDPDLITTDSCNGIKDPIFIPYFGMYVYKGQNVSLSIQDHYTIFVGDDYFVAEDKYGNIEARATGTNVAYFNCTFWISGSKEIRGGRIYPGHDRKYEPPNYNEYVKDDVISFNDYTIEILDTQSNSFTDCKCQLKISDGSHSETRWVSVDDEIEVFGLKITDASHCEDGFNNEVVCRYKLLDYSIPEKSCYDSDGGKNYYTKGYVTTEKGTFWDSCVDENIQEELCLGNQASESITQCPSGFVCNDGVCITSSDNTDSKTGIDLSDYPKMFVDEDDFYGLLIVGEKAHSIDTIAITNIALGLQREIKNTIYAAVNKFDTEIYDPTSLDLITIGGPCANSVTRELMGNPKNCNEGFEEGMAILKLIRNGDKTALIIAGGTGKDTKIAANVLKDHRLYTSKLKGKEIILDTGDPDNIGFKIIN